MSELSERVVAAAFFAAYPEGESMIPDEPNLEAAIAATIREVAKNADEVEMALSWDLYLTELADEIDGIGSDGAQ